MLKKRVIGVVTVKNGWAVQSFGYGRYLPLGKPECLVENLDRWGADEILLQVIDRTVADRGPDFELLKKISRLALGTPLIYGGGIRTVPEGVKVIQSGADRIALDSLLQDNLKEVNGLGMKLGAQAVIASMPMAMRSNKCEWFDYRSKSPIPIGDALSKVIEDGLISEVLLTDFQNEGRPNGFDYSLIDLFPYRKVSLIVFGGISSSEQMKILLARSNVSAVSVGNFLNYREHAIQQLKEDLASTAIRPSTYATEHTLLNNV